MPIKNLEQRRKYKHVWYMKHRERILEERKKYSDRNKDYIKLWRAAYYKENKEYLQEQNRKNSKESRVNNKDLFKDRDLRKKYNITLEDYYEIYHYQAGKCYLCEEPETSMNQYGVRRLAVDHCHNTGQIRGLACSRCNMGILGGVKDNLELLIKIVDNFKRAIDKQSNL